SDIRIQEKKAKLFNELEMFTSTDGESIESYYHRFLKLMNDSRETNPFQKIFPVVQNTRNQYGVIVVLDIANHNGNDNVVAARAKGNGNGNGNNGNQVRCYNCRGLGIQLQAEEFDLMAATSDLDEIKEVNANCILMANLQQASTSGTQSDKAPVYNSDRSSKVHDYKNFYNNEIFNMFTQEEQYTKLL
nr:hypothetical protein [Tanacetum cinerariifolium]